MRRTYQTRPQHVTPQLGRRGIHIPRYAILKAGQDIPVADCLVGVDEDGYVLPASEYGSVADFLEQFAGVCPMAHEAADHDRVITIYATGNYEFDVATTDTYPVGRAVAPVLNGAGDAVENRKVDLVADSSDLDEAIGAVAAHAPEPNNWHLQAGATKVEVAIFAPRMIHGWAPEPQQGG